MDVTHLGSPSWCQRSRVSGQRPISINGTRSTGCECIYRRKRSRSFIHRVPYTSLSQAYSVVHMSPHNYHSNRMEIYHMVLLQPRTPKTQICRLLRLLATQCKIPGWRRRESNPHFRDATAACSRYTTSPRPLLNMLFYKSTSGNSTYFYTAFGESSELPRIVADYFIYRLAFRLWFTIGRITYSHQLNDSYILRDC